MEENPESSMAYNGGEEQLKGLGEQACGGAAGASFNGRALEPGHLW